MLRNIKHLCLFMVAKDLVTEIVNSWWLLLTLIVICICSVMTCYVTGTL
jgi:hypothetical protein